MGDNVDQAGAQALPDELLLQIFGQLSLQDLGRAAQVCQRWRDVCYDPSLYKNVELAQGAYGPGTLGFVLERGTERLVIRRDANKAAFATPLFLQEMLPGTSYRLKTLVNGSLYEGLQSILRRCRQLTEVRLLMPSIDYDLMCALAEARSIEDLQIITCENGPSFIATITIVRGCRRLRTFNCHGYSNTFTEQEMFRLAGELPQTIEKTNLFSSSDVFTDENVASLVDCLPNLVDLYLQYCPNLTAKSLQHLATLKKLEKLHISYYPGIDINAFREFNRMESLKMLLLHGSIDRDAHDKIQELLPRIKVSNPVYFKFNAPP